MTAERGAVRLLVVAGHDSSGGAGVAADREVARALGAELACVVTAWTVQDAAGVRDVGAREPAAWLAEARERGEAQPAALKFGLLPGAAHFESAALLASELRARLGEGFPVVLDPVLAASSGTPFLAPAEVAALLRALPRIAPVLTPNIEEAAILSGLALEELSTDPSAHERAAGILAERGARAVVLKGGHGREDPALDLVWQPDEGAQWIEHARIAGGAIRGSGCRHATAVAIGLARGLELTAAARAAAAYVAELIALQARRARP